ncbi:MAG: hypothetical protein D6731_01930 [Planctomycetota bacterium]|nr:MAG: hypothetical protein D6731_01930 [Planctomycetota bacterium]
MGLSQRTVSVPASGGVPAFAYSFQVYVGQGYDPAVPAPLVVAGNMGLAPWRALADAEGLIVLDFRDVDRNGGYTFAEDVLALDAALGDVEARWNVDTRRRYFHGFSAAAHWGYAVVLANANTFAGLGVNAGSMQFALSTGVWPNNVPRKIAVAIRHGTADAVVPYAAATDAQARLQAAQHPVRLSSFAGGHTVSAQDAQEVWSFLRGFQAP